MVPQPPSPPIRILGALLLGLFLAAGLADVHHRAAVAHVLCPVDGQVAHAEDHGHGHGHGHDGADGSEAPDDEGPALVAGGEEEGGHHEHCGLADLGSSDDALPVAEASDGPPRFRTTPLKIEAGASRHASVPLLSLAPKQSPPRAV